MSATAVTKLAKPRMRKLFYNEAKKQLVGATIFSFTVVGAWKFFVTDVKKEKFAEFYANYDPEAEYKRLKACGVYKSIPNDDD